MAITLTMAKAAEETGLSLRTLQYAITRGELETLTVGRRRLIPEDALRRFLEAGRPKPGDTNKKSPRLAQGKSCAY